MTHKSRTIHYVLCHQHLNAEHGMRRMANAIQLDHTHRNNYTLNSQYTKQTIFQSKKLLDLFTPCTLALIHLCTNAHTHIEYCTDAKSNTSSVLAPNLIKFNFPVSSKVLHCSLICRLVFRFVFSLA